MTPSFSVFDAANRNADICNRAGAEDILVVDAQVSVPRFGSSGRGSSGRGTPPDSDASSVIEVPIVGAHAARQTSKSARIRAVAANVPPVIRFHVASCNRGTLQMIGHHCPLPVCGNVPTGRAKASGVVHRIPGVDAAVFVQRPRLFAGVTVGAVFVARAAPLPVHRHGA